MQRKRYQKGSLKKRCGKWVGQWRENGVRRNQVLGPIATMRKSDARAALDKVLVAVNERPSPVASASCTLRDFVEDVFFPFHLRKWKTSTASSTMYRIRHHLVGELGSRVLREINRQDMQGLLDGKAQTGLSYSTVDHLRWDLNQILEMALAEGVVVKNAATLLFTPREATRGITRIMTLEEVKRCFLVLDQRERLIVKFAVLAGMRPGEIFALKWGDLGPGHVRIERRVYKRVIDTPKSHNSRRDAAVSQGLGFEIETWRARLIGTEADHWVFPSEHGRTPLSVDNCWNRHIKPKLKAIGLEWATFQVMRRTHSSLMHEQKADPKLVADQLGHTVDVNQNVYTKIPVERRREAVDQLENRLIM